MDKDTADSFREKEEAKQKLKKSKLFWRNFVSYSKKKSAFKTLFSRLKKLFILKKNGISSLYGINFQKATSTLLIFLSYLLGEII